MVAEPATTSPRASYEDLLAVPAHLVAQIINGVLHTSPRPATRHARAASSLGGRLDGPFDKGPGGPGGWIILDQPELHLGEHVLVPDLAGWRRTTMPELPLVAAVTTRPDWVCEVLSEATEATDRAEKMPIHEAQGVQHVWLIDPVLQTLEVFRLERGRWMVLATHRDNATVRAEPFDALVLDLALLWMR